MPQRIDLLKISFCGSCSSHEPINNKVGSNSCLFYNVERDSTRNPGEIEQDSQLASLYNINMNALVLNHLRS